MNRLFLLTLAVLLMGTKPLEASAQPDGRMLKSIVSARHTRAHISEPSTAPYFPHTGSPRLLVILVDFPDVPFTLDDPKLSFEQFFNGETQTDLGHKEHRNACSFGSYFKTVSHGQFAPQADIVGPVRVKENASYYGAGADNVSPLCSEAIALVDDEVDFTLYDNDDNGIVEAVCIVYAGFGENAGASEDAIWAKTTSASVQTGEGLKVTRFCLASELNGSSPEAFPDQLPWINGIGVFVHEFSHTLGLPDFYPVSESSKALNNQCMECWDLMDNGEYLNNGYTPMAYTAWEQETMSWLEIEQLRETRSGIELTPVIEGGKAYKFGNGENPEEFIIVENIQQRGLNAKAYGHGLLAYHVAYDRSEVAMLDFPNDVAGKPRMTVIPADGLLLSYNQIEGKGYGGTYTQNEYLEHHAGDTFPGTCGITELTAGMMLPNYALYDGATDFALQNIREDAATGVVTFDFVKGGSTGINSVKQDSAGDGLIYTLDGRCVGKDLRRLPRGLYIRNGKKVVVR